MKILMVTPYLPYPLFSGGQVRSYNIIKELSKKHEITLFCAIRNEEENAYIPVLSKFARVKTFYRGRAFTFSNIFRSFFSSWPFILTVYQIPELKEAIAKELAENKYDLIHVETFYMMQNLPRQRRGLPQIILFEQNIEYEVYKKIAERFRPSIVRPLLMFDARKIKEWEKHFWGRANRLVVMSEAEKKIVERQAYVCGNGVDVKKFKVPAFVKTSARQAKFKINHGEKKILFIGNFKWFQNVDAVRFILEEIWPAFVKTSAGKPKIKLWIVGKNIPDSIKRLTSDENVIFDENAPVDTRKIYAAADLLLAPIRAGGGTSYKVLEAMASGLAVVTTPVVEKALEAKDERELLVGNSAEELAQKTIKILQNNNLYKNLSANARKFVEKNYDWKVITGKIEEIYG